MSESNVRFAWVMVVGVPLALCLIFLVAAVIAEDYNCWDGSVRPVTADTMFQRFIDDTYEMSGVYTHPASIDRWGYRKMPNGRVEPFIEKVPEYAHIDTYVTCYPPLDERGEHERESS